MKLDLTSIASLLPETSSKSEVLSSELIKRVLTYCEVRFHFEGSYPSEEELKSHFKLNSARLREVLVPVNKGLVNTRDLKPVIFDELESFEVDPEFLYACNLVVDALDKRSVSAKMKHIGKTTTWWNNQLKNPLNKELYQVRIKELYANVPELAKIALVRNVEAGDLQSIKHVEESLGITSKNDQVILNFQLIINRMMEVLVKFLTPEQLEKVALQFEDIIDVKETERKEIA